MRKDGARVASTAAWRPTRVATREAEDCFLSSEREETWEQIADLLGAGGTYTCAFLPGLLLAREETPVWVESITRLGNDTWTHRRVGVVNI